MILRPAFPDELGRARALVDGHPMPAAGAFLLLVKEQPVERILTAIPWWLVPGPDGQLASLRFFLSGSGTGVSDHLATILSQLETLARQHEAAALFTDFPLPENHPLFLPLIAHGYGICLTDRHFSVPGAAKTRDLRIYERLRHRIPPQWRIAGIRGQDPQQLFALAAAHSLISPQQFQNYWNGANRERFEDDYSCVLLAGEEIIGLFLVTRRGEDELHIHVEAASPAHAAQSPLISACLRQASFSRCPEGFPRIFTCRADSEKHRQTGNTMLRHGATEGPPRHFLRKLLP